MMFGQRMTNTRHFSNAHTIAAASPSVGAYLHSASVQNLPLANSRHQPLGQQLGAFSIVHWQCSRRSRKPIPCLLQSGARQVTWSLLNVVTPFWTRTIITSLESLNASSRLWFQANLEFFLTRSRKSNITGSNENTQATWLMIPNHDMGSVIVFGTGKLSITCIIDSKGVTPEGVIWSPPNYTTFW